MLYSVSYLLNILHHMSLQMSLHLTSFFYFDNCYYEKIGKNEPVKLEDLPFDIPDNWSWIRLKNTSELLGGYAFKSEKFSPNGIRVIRISDFDERGIKNKDIKRYPYSKELEQYKIYQNDILMCMTGGTVGKSTLIKDIFEDSYINQRVALIRIKHIDVKYFYCLLLSSYISNIVHENKTSTNDNISMKLIEDFLLPLPPIEEQQRIVDKINSFEPLLQEYDNYEKKLTELESTFADKLKKSILQYAIEGKLVKQDPNDEPASVLLERIKAEKEKLIKEGKIKRDKNESYIYQGDDKNYYENIPDSWSLTTLSKISSLITKGTTPKGGNVSYLNKGIRFLRAENVLGFDKISDIDLKYISEETHNNYLKRSILLEDDILITIAGTLGRTGLVRKKDLPLNTNQAISIVRLINKHLIKLRYLTYVLNAPSIQKCLVDQKKITAIPNLTLEIISNCIIPIAPTNQQNNIVSKLDYLFSLL
ncbi:restriction endonuclease subunit S [Mycoplasmopsis arginini]|uniref:restriction endonuclease subunit S n=4 Tax=Mycoplasmopsis arginini TaxID=2094 RepID=UPI00249DB125|nr:restriction endonuclease subunit S [Mycoplasmopsis arginini]MDI3349103.1 restriction endonuclease subunit S [Mycoplasmopsis arginini]MDI3350287.1 restriction endonuclease subunit S [Mycoplasmopsis arginini]MDI3350922.1 restriction endonuclease subunit S [Mycoplasmopsis arginini]